MTDLNISPAEREEILKPASQIISRARYFEITKPEQYTTAGEELKRIKAAQKELDARKCTLLDPVNATLRAIRNLFARPEAELAEAENLFKRSMIAYSDEQERIRQAEQRKLDEAAERERIRKQKEADEAEAKAKAAREAGDIVKAEKLERKADTLTDAAAAVVAPIAQREAPRVSGVAERENWTAVVTDKSALIKAVAEGRVPEIALEPNMRFLNVQAKAMKRELNYPGVRPARETILAAGSK